MKRIQLMNVLKIASLCVAAIGISHGQLVRYNFNETGTTAANSGSASSLDLTLNNSSNVATDLHSSSGGGVLGGSGDRAFDNSASLGMGNSPGTGGYARSSGDVSGVFGGLTSFTLQGWFNSSVVVGNGAQLINYTSGNNGFAITTPNTGNLSLSVNNVAAFGSGTAYNATSTWVFFAVTYDGSNARFYVGDSVSTTSLAYTVGLSAGSVIAASTSAGLTVGNNNVGNRPYDGLLDNVRIYGATSGTGGALDLAAIEAIRVADTSAIPEPSSAAGIAGLTILSLAFFTRRKKCL